VKTTPRSFEPKRKTARTRRLAVRITLRGRARKNVLGGLLSIVKKMGWLVPVRPARSVPLTAKPCGPSARPVAGMKGDAQGLGGAPSREQEKPTGRLAEKEMLGLGLLSRAFGPASILTCGGRATRLTAPKASTNPAPTASGPKAPTGRALDPRAVRAWGTERVGLAWRISAATAAACGAAAEVPQKRLTPGIPVGRKKVVRPQSVAARSGLAIWSGWARGAAGEDPLTGPK
jgi:hypothetical protein